MAGFRLYNPILAEGTYDPDLLVLADKDGLPQAIVVPMKYMGNTIAEGGTDLINWESPLSASHTKIRFSTDGGDNWIPFTIPSAEGTRDLLESLVGSNRLNASALYELDTFIDDQILDHLETNSIDTAISHYHYWGDRDTDDSWRIGIEDGNMVFQRREIGSWANKLRLNKIVTLEADTESFELTGSDLNTNRNYNAIMDVGSFTLTGINVDTVGTFSAGLSTGSFTLTGPDVTITIT